MLPNLTKPHAPEAFISQNKKGESSSTVVDLQYLTLVRELLSKLTSLQMVKSNDKHYGIPHLQVPQASFCPCVNMYLCLRTSLLLEGSFNSVRNRWMRRQIQVVLAKTSLQALLIHNITYRPGQSCES